MRINSGLLGVAAFLGIVFLIISVYAPQSANPIIEQNCAYILACESNEAIENCNCSDISASDNVYPNTTSFNGLQTSGGNIALINISLNQTDIPNGSTITNVITIIEWYITGTPDECVIEVYNGTWEIVNTTCVETEDNYSYDINDFIDNESEAENILIRINASRVSGSSILYVDQVYVNVTYLPPHYTRNWNLSYSNGSISPSGLVFYRNETLNASAFWTADNVYNAYAEHNGTASFVNYSVNLSSGYYPVNWTNYTLNLSNTTHFPQANNITVRMHAEDEYGQWNTTMIDYYFTLWGESQIAELTFDDNTIVNGSNTSLYCNVSDINSSVSLQNYNVSFYADHILFNHTVTNSTGMATGIYVDSSTAAGNVSIICNITNQSDIYYITSGVSSQTGNITVSLPDHYTQNWNLTYANGTIATDGTGFYRRDLPNASAFWITDNLVAAFTEHNGTGAFTNYSVALNVNWTNYT
ncbi:MAG: hypothetical protein KKC05_00610, partial [Nanoarchaeota archaeon]|nr:hypothetical protein [Nanoarchaeota archaeon]